jgi:hypothetical protein
VKEKEDKEKNSDLKTEKRLKEGEIIKESEKDRVKE